MIILLRNNTRLLDRHRADLKLNTWICNYFWSSK